MEHEHNANDGMADMLGMMMQMFGGADEASADQAAKLRQIMDMARMMQAFGQLGADQDSGQNSSEDISDTGENETSHSSADTRGRSALSGFYDDPILTPELVAIKSAIPHIERKYQRPLGMLVKLVEMRRLMELYEPEADMRAQSASEKDTGYSERRRNMLGAIRANITDEKTRTQIDILQKAMDISELLKKLGKANVP